MDGPRWLSVTSRTQNLLATISYDPTATLHAGDELAGLQVGKSEEDGVLAWSPTSRDDPVSDVDVSSLRDFTSSKLPRLETSSRP